MDLKSPSRRSLRNIVLLKVFYLPSALSVGMVLLFATLVGSHTISPQDDGRRDLPVNPFRQRQNTEAGIPASSPNQPATTQLEHHQVPTLPNQPGVGAAPAQVNVGGQNVPAAAVMQPTPMVGGDAPAAGALSYDPLAARTEIETKLAAIQESAEWEESLKAEAVKRLNKALESLTNATEAVQRTGVFEAELSQGGQRIADLKAVLATPTQEPVLSEGEESPLKLLEQRLVEAETKLKTAKEELALREEELNRRSERSAELTKLISDASKRLEEAQKQLAAPPVTGENEVLVEARRLELRARIWAAERQRQLWETETKRSEALAELFPLQRDQANRRVNFLTKEVDARQKQVTQRRKSESERQALEARRQVENALPGLHELAERNAELAEMRAQMASAIEKLEAEVKASQDRATELQDELALTREKLERSNHSSATGLMLRKQREELPDLELCRQRLRFVKQELPKVQLTLLELSDERAPLSNIDELAESTVETLGEEATRFEEGYVKSMVAEMLTTRRDFLDSLRDDYDTYVRDLSELELTTAELNDVGGEFRDLIDEHILWIRSDEPLNVEIAKSSLTQMTILFDPQGWSTLPTIALAELKRVPGLGVLCLAATALCMLFNGRLRSRLKAVTREGAKKGELAFQPTLEGLAILAVLTGQIPVFLLFLSWRFRVAAEANAFSDGWAASIYVVAILIWVSRFARALMMPNRLGTLHFEWSAGMQRVLRRHLFWFTWAVVPLGAIVAFSHGYGEGELAGAVGRVAFIACAIGISIFCYTAFRPNGRFYRDLASGGGDSFLYRIRYVTSTVVIGAPIVLSALALWGYYYSVSQLVVRLQWSMAAIGILIIVHATVSRWFVVKRRNLSIRQARERLASSQEEVHSLPSTDREAAQAELGELHNQLRYLLRNALIVSGVLAAWMIWFDVLPALKVLDRVELWNRSIEVSEVVEQPDGTQVVETTDQVISITLRHAFLAFLVLVATYMIGLNLPALLQIIILERLPIDHGGRHAIGLIVRYVVTLAGTIFACRILCISWGSVQWLAAAMTVGLGFGMQEIFANFVSGLIILFERPVRVGDMVTVGGVTGRVTRTQIRATTITDFDRRELIVPNKKFITDDVMNWTLSDHVNRVVIEVGVAYGSDVERVRTLLLKTASANKEVLQEPEPSVTFDRFADSWLNFTLRCFLPNMDNRLGVIHDLHHAIDRLFQDEGISIAFPQQDIHVHGLEPLINRIKIDRDENRAEAA